MLDITKKLNFSPHFHQKITNRNLASTIYIGFGISATCFKLDLWLGIFSTYMAYLLKNLPTATNINIQCFWEEIFGLEFFQNASGICSYVPKIHK